VKHAFTDTDDLKQRILESDQGIPKEMLQHIMRSFPSLLQESVEQQDGSPTKCHTQTVMIHTIYLPLLIIFFPFALKVLFHFKNLEVFLVCRVFC